MSEAMRWMHARAWVGSLCVLAWMVCVSCTGEDDQASPGSLGGTSGGGGVGGSGNGAVAGISGGPSGAGGGGNGGTAANDAGLECLPCPEGASSCATTTAELCDALDEGCPELATWLICGERGEIVGDQYRGEPRIVRCGSHTVIERPSGYLGFRRWIYDDRGALVGAESVSDTGGPRCGLLLPELCRTGTGGQAFVRHHAADAGLDSGAIGDGGPDADTGSDSDGGSSALDCSRL